MVNKEEIRRLFKMYLDGKTNNRQQQILFRYLNKNKHADRYISDLMENAWQQEASSRDDSANAEKGLEEVWLGVDGRKQERNRGFWMLKYAASLLIICSAALTWYNYQKPHSQPLHAIAINSKSTALGEKVKLMLPDSSIVYLGAASKLTWPEYFEKGKNRKIQLEGEAFFEIKHDASRPFIIESGKMETRVLGTSFNIYAYPLDKIFTVTVKTGKVGVMEMGNNGARKTLSLLTPGMELVYQKNSGSYIVNTKRLNDVNSWTSNRFVFRDESLQAMLIKLERYYNIRFELKNLKLSDCRFNATFANKTITDVMKQLKIMTGGHINYKVNEKNQTIALWGEACQ